MNKLVTSGYIAKLFKQADKNTIIRRPNLRRFAEQNDVEYYVHDTAWLINFDDFMSKINPQGKQVKCEMPLLRNKHDSLIRFNRSHKYAVDKHTIDRCTASDNVSKFLHGRIWIILSQNVPIQTVSKYMGHSDSTVTLEVYSHFIPDTQEKAVFALNNLTK